MKKRRISTRRIVVAFILYLIIGIIPIKLSDSNIGEAKSELAKQLLEEDRNYSAVAKDILEKSATDPRYAEKQIHVWDSYDTALCDYDTYLGGGRSWRRRGIIIPDRGREVARAIINQNDSFFFIHLLGWAWLVIVPSTIIYLFQREESREIEERIEKNRQKYQK